MGNDCRYRRIAARRDYQARGYQKRSEESQRAAIRIRELMARGVIVLLARSRQAVGARDGADEERKGREMISWVDTREIR